MPLALIQPNKLCIRDIWLTFQQETRLVKGYLEFSQFFFSRNLFERLKCFSGSSKRKHARILSSSPPFLSRHSSSHGFTQEGKMKEFPEKQSHAILAIGLPCDVIEEQARPTTPVATPGNDANYDVWKLVHPHRVTG